MSPGPEDPLSEDLLRGTFLGKDLITARVTQDTDGEKKLIFEGTSVAEPELVEAGESK